MDEIIAAFSRKAGNPQVPLETEKLKLSTAERDHVLTAFERNKRNISATARELGVHRRTLQRKLEKLQQPNFRLSLQPGVLSVV